MFAFKTCFTFKKLSNEKFLDIRELGEKSLLIIKSRDTSNGKIGHFLASLFADSIPFPYDIPWSTGSRFYHSNNDARKWPILPFDVSRDFIISNDFSPSSRISRNFSLDNFLTYLKCLCKFRKSRDTSNGKIGHFLASLFADSIPFPYDIPWSTGSRFS
jgi:hypothetical protein